jgi:hypothetical protein
MTKLLFLDGLLQDDIIEVAIDMETGKILTMFNLRKYNFEIKKCVGFVSSGEENSEYARRIPTTYHLQNQFQM